MSARDAIFAKLRAAPVDTAKTLPDVAAWYAGQRRTESIPQRAARLRAALEAAHTEVHAVTPANWTAKLLQLCAEKQLHSLLIGKHTPHGAAVQASAAQGLEILRYDQPIAAWQDRLFDGVDASLTLAQSAIAETGSLVLWPSPEEPRLMSLVPSVHFVLLDAKHIHADFHQALTAEGWTAGMPTNALLISGPSKTADIQQTLAYGAHGPKELVLLLLQAEAEAL
ncbi:MAG: lactate utilization protein [Rhodoferax sp.]|nr:lactate utilization protein [Rhodoferax sp.]